jgi:hypothetical protein
MIGTMLHVQYSHYFLNYVNVKGLLTSEVARLSGDRGE